MKITFISLMLLFIFVYGQAKEIKYTGSTPASPVVRSFLGIPLSDSVDFIKWQLTLQDDHYTLNCDYGIARPDTNGFMDDKQTVTFSGALIKEKNIYSLNNNSKTLYIIELNKDLLQLLDTNKKMLTGNGGWSYTLNNLTPEATDGLNVTVTPSVFKDSIAFEGRTPCSIPGVVAAGMQCYKLKWYIVLYKNMETSHGGTYRLSGTAYRSQGWKEGNWKVLIGKNRTCGYELLDEKENAFLYLLEADDNILLFADAQGKLLVGNEDFSYTLNRVYW